MGYGVPSWVEKDFRAYLKCGILAHGFARAYKAIAHPLGRAPRTDLRGPASAARLAVAR